MPGSAALLVKRFCVMGDGYLNASTLLDHRASTGTLEQHRYSLVVVIPSVRPLVLYQKLNFPFN